MGKKPDEKKIRIAIDAIPICEDGKNAVRSLIEEITGLKLTAPIMRFQVGDIVRNSTCEYMITKNKDNGYSLVVYKPMDLKNRGRTHTALDGLDLDTFKERLREKGFEITESVGVPI